MSKFKIGDKVRLKDDATDWNKEMYGREIIVSWDVKISERSAVSSAWCVTQYPDDFELVATTSVEDVSKRHIHHDMIVEWAKDPSRVVECKDPEDRDWRVDNYPCWLSDVEYRFKPAEPERVFPKTSLTHNQVMEIYDNTSSDDFVDALIAVANAAIKQYILEQENILDTEKNDD